MMRAIVYSCSDERLFELLPDEVLECRRDETINGERSVTITTTRKLDKGQRLLIRPDGGEWSEWTVEGEDEGRPYGASTGTYWCPWSLRSDMAGTVCSKMPGAKTPVDAREGMEAALSGTKRWMVGEVTVEGTGGVSMWNVSGWEALSRVTKTWGGELDVHVIVNRRKVTHRFVDLLDRMGSVRAVHRFDYTSDLKDVGRVVADSPVYCRIIPRGKGQETEGGGTGRKIGIESVNDGRNYVENPDAEGFRLPVAGGWEYPTVIVENGSIEEPEELLEWAVSVLPQYTTPQVSYKASVAVLGFTPHLGDTVHVVDNGFIGGGIRLQARVQRIVTNLLDPTDTSIYLGNVTDGLPGVFRSLDDRISNAVDKAKADMAAQMDDALANLDISIDMDEIDRRFDAAEQMYAEVKAEADAVSDRATTLASQITDVTTTVNGTVLPGMTQLSTSVAGAVSNASSAVSSVTTITQKVNGIVAGTSQDYTEMVGNITNSLKNDSSLIITASGIEGLVTETYINNLVGSSYIARTQQYQTADSIVTSATGTAKAYTDGQLTQYTKTANLSVEAGSIKANVLAILNDSYGGGSGADPYIRSSALTFDDSQFSILFSEGVVGGGVNLLLDTNRSSLSKVNGPANRAWSNASTAYTTQPAFASISNPPVTGIEYGTKHIIASEDIGKAAKSLTWYGTTTPLPVLPLEDGEKYTLSVYARRVSGNSAKVYLGVSGVGSKKVSMTKSVGAWERCSYTFTYDEAAAAASSAASYRGRAYIGVEPTAAGTFELCGFKLEHGPFATDWSLNPIEYTAETLLAQTTASTASTTAYNALDMASAADSKATTAMGDATTAIQRQTAYYGTCETAAGTAAKVVDCTNFTLSEGATVTVTCTTASNNTGKLTLNVNSTGAKDVYVAGAVTGDTNRIIWAPGAQMTFSYDGSHWNLVSDPRSWRTSSSTVAGTASKEMTIDKVVMCKGTTVVADMANSNTNTAPTLNIRYTSGSTTASLSNMAVYAGSGTTRPMNSNALGWTAGSTTPFVYDGKAWRMGDSTALSRAVAASKTATNYMSFQSGTGLVIGDMNSQHSLDRNIVIGSSSIDFRYSSTVLGQLSNVQKANPKTGVTENFMKLANGATYGGVLICGTNTARLTATEGGVHSGTSYIDSRSNSVTSGSTTTEYDSWNLGASYTSPQNILFSSGLSGTATSAGTIDISAVVQRGSYSGNLSMMAFNDGNGNTRVTLAATGFDEIMLGRTVLFNDGNGYNGNIGLVDDIRKYRRVKVYYKDDDGTLCGSVDLPNMGTVGVCFDIWSFSAPANNSTWAKRTRYSVGTHPTKGDGYQLNKVYGGEVGFADGVVTHTNVSTGYLYITRVEGFMSY